MSSRRPFSQYPGRALEILRSRCYLDLGAPEQTILLSGIARSGTTWLGGILQEATRYRSIFEPFFPDYVPASQACGYFPYVSADDDWAEMEAYSDQVFSGKVRGKWVDRDNTQLIFRGRIVKEIRLNYALAWLGERYAELPIILTVRNPFQVYASWRYLNWLTKKTEEHFSLERLVNDSRFNQSYPEVVLYYKAQNFVQGSFSQFIYDWYLSYAVPLRELKPERYCFVGYEELVGSFDGQMKRIREYLGMDFDMERLATFAQKPSSTDYGNRAQGKQRQAEQLQRELEASGEWAKAHAIILELSGMRLEEVLTCPASAFRTRSVAALKLGL